MPRQLPRHLGLMLLGYLAAVLAAAITASLILSLFFPAYNPDVYPSLTAKIANQVEILLALTVAASIFMAFAALPVWLIVTCLFEWFNVRARGAYLVTGMIAAAPFLVNKTETEPELVSLWVTGLAAGFVGGLAYWRIAGRNAGKWKLRTITGDAQ